MPDHFFARRWIWWPTRLGWVCLHTLFLAVPIVWGVWGEPFLAVTELLPAEVLVVEGWSGRESMSAAVREFERGSYQLLVTAGGPAADSWAVKNCNYAQLAAEELVHCGMSKEKMLAAPAGDSDSQRTYTSAVAVHSALTKRGPLPVTINVLTRGSHARRSRLVYAKVFGPKTRVGVMAWTPEHSRSKPWWRSSERAKDFLSETMGYSFERLLGSGRWLLKEAAPGSEVETQNQTPARNQPASGP